MPFATPVRDMALALRHMAGIGRLAETGAYPEFSTDIVDAILEEAAKYCDNVLAPLNWESDRNGAVLENGAVRTTPGFKEAYQQYIEGGWPGLAFPESVGGQNLPVDPVCGADRCA